MLLESARSLCTFVNEELVRMIVVANRTRAVAHGVMTTVVVVGPGGTSIPSTRFTTWRPVASA